MSGSGDDLTNSYDERWVQVLEKTPLRGRLWWWIVGLELSSLSKFRRRRGVMRSEDSHPELACLKLVGHPPDMVAAAQRRAFRADIAEMGPLFALLGVGLLVYLIAVPLSLLGDVGLALSAFLALLYTSGVISLGMWGVGYSSEAEYRLFSLIVGAVDELDTLRRLKVVQFTPSDSGRQKIVKIRRNRRKSLRREAREAVLLAASLTGTRTSDKDYFECARLGLWLRHASENIDKIEALGGALYACGCALDHLMREKSWEVAELPPAPGDAADLSTSWIGKVAQYVGARIQLGSVTALIGLTAAIFGLVAKIF
ncbi:hypothetical protein ACFVYA_28850 [Amycolatopsis sp. NPDC058278]|uniref:hypothetical protein n=1 Tax=Amycolatopsis sp. NPDC058278 TaxID=3346417 RepID=UPI0036DCB8C0